MKDLKQTIELMNSNNYKERFKAEYWQTKIRTEELHKILIKADANTLEFKPDTPLHLLESQQRIMLDYLRMLVRMLEIRAEIEGINLDE